MAHNLKTQQRTAAESSGASIEEKVVLIPAKPTPLYLKLLRALHLTKDQGIYVGIVIFLLIGLAITQATRQKQGIPAKAGTNTIRITIQPAANVMPPNTTYQLWATADNPVSFATVTIVFNPTLVKMIGELSTSPSPLTRVVQQTPMSEANTTGVIHLSLALDPTRRATPPTGTFELATIPMSAATTQNISTSLHFDALTMQVVNPDLSLFTMTTVDSSITLNPPPTPTPIPPTSTPTPTATPIPSPTPTRTPTPTPIPPTSTPVPTTFPTPTPTPPVTQDVVTIQSAYISRTLLRIPRLTVVATSTMAPTAKLTVTGFGSLKYSSSKHTYSKNFWVVGTWPTFITVTSSDGGSATAPVAIQ